MTLEFPSEIPEIGDVVRIDITMFDDSVPPKKINDIGIEGLVIYRKTQKEETYYICLAHHTYHELEYKNGKWRCCWLHDSNHEVELSIF